MYLIMPICARSLLRRISVANAVVSLLPLLLLVISQPARADDGVRVTGTEGTSQAFSAARLKATLASDLKTVGYDSHDQKHTCTGVPLLALLKAAGVPITLKMDPKADPHMKNYNLRLAVVVQGGDGYTATFSLAELLPEIGGREAWLALDEDGKPLPERDGSMKLIVPADQRPARWVRNVTNVSVIDPTTAATGPTTQPAPH
jgi:Oxidoreductase molybdopterin binding domain